MELGEAFTYIFKDKRWFTKVIIAALVSTAPVINFAFAGYIANLIRNIEENCDEPLPSWDEIGKPFRLGLYLWVAGIVFSLPILILALLYIVPATLTGTGNNSESFSSIFISGGIILACLFFLYTLALSLLIPALYINLARKETFNSVFEISEFIKIFRSNPGDYLIAWLVTLISSIFIVGIGMLLIIIVVFIPIVGWLAAYYISLLISVSISLVFAHLFGKVAAKNKLLSNQINP